jgi:hypothetical protein
MSDFERRSPETYAKLQTAEAADFAGERGRRNSRCREEYLIGRYSEAIAAIDGISRERRDSFTLSVKTCRRPVISSAFPTLSNLLSL